MSASTLGHVRGAGPVRVGVVGDLVLDRYLRGETERISPEAPIPVLAVREEEVRVGGAGNVARNLLALGAEVRIVGVVGDDENGRLLRDELERLGCPNGGVVTAPDRPTVEKTRLVARAQQVLRVDREETRPIAGETERRVREAVTRELADCDAIVISDYAKGTLTAGVLETVFGLGRRALVDPKGRDYARYRGAWAITPNRAEAEAATGIALDGPGRLEEAAQRLFDLAGVEVVVVTLGAEGIYCQRRGESGFRVRSEARRVYDVTGAGDTVIALLARYVAAGVPLAEAVRIANVGAGIVVGKPGAAVVTSAELRQALAHGGDASMKVVSAEEALAVVSEARALGRSVVFTNGCFDLFHAGHARYLREAREQGDLLVVGLNDDASVRRLKGPDRPLQPLADRAEVLASLEAVDLVVPFEEDTPEALIRLLKPDVLVKGADWRGREVAGASFVLERGGRVHFAPLLPGRSTSGLVERLRDRGG